MLVDAVPSQLARRRLLLTACDLLDGKTPPGLVGIDPYSGKPFQRKIVNGRLRLFSVGPKRGAASDIGLDFQIPLKSNR